MRKADKEKHPPGWAVRFLEWFCPDDLLEGIFGDLLEQYELDRETWNDRKARTRFIWNVIRFFHPSIFLRNHLSLRLIHMGMLRNHLLVAFRSMKKYKFYAAVNILGLSVATGFVFLAFLFIQNEWNIDQFHTHKGNIYRVYHKMVNEETGEEGDKSAVTAIPLARDLQVELPFIRFFSRHGSSSGTVQKDNQSFAELITFVDPAFLKMFDFPLLAGNINTALGQPGSVVLSTEKAKIFFGESDPIGQSLAIEINDTTLNVLVSGLIDARSTESSIQFGILLPFDHYRAVVPASLFDSYDFGLVENYILIEEPDLPRQEWEAVLSRTIHKYASADERRMDLGLQALSGLHFEDQIRGNTQYTSPRKLYIMLTLALLVLVIAAINFITLSTSHGLNRIKEIGLRKTFGALGRQLSSQLIAESIVITLISTTLGVLLAYSLLPLFAELVESSMAFSLNWEGVLFLAGVTLVIGLLSGFLLSIILVKYHPVAALKGKLLFSGYNSWFNQGLIIVQFALSILLIIGAIHIQRQMAYIHRKDLGFDQERLIEISMSSSGNQETARQLLERFRSLGMQDSRILQVSATMNNAREPWTSLVFEQSDGSKESIFYNQVDPDYLKTMDIQLLAGMDFPENAGSEFNGILVNEALVHHFGWDDALSEHLPGKNFQTPPSILGVVKDFHFSSLHQRIEPLILAVNEKNTVAEGITGLSTYVWPPNWYQLVVRIGPGELKPIIDHLQEIWKKVNPGKDFTFHFVDEVLAAQYAEDQRWSKIINLGSLFAIGIAWLGLLGLMRLSIQKRTREIGIRKVLGSPLPALILLLAKRFMVLVTMSMVIAWPIAWIMIGRWLESFSYRININPLLFLAACLGVLVLALFSAGWQSWRIATANPSDSLQ